MRDGALFAGGGVHIPGTIRPELRVVPERVLFGVRKWVQVVRFHVPCELIQPSSILDIEYKLLLIPL